MTLSQTERLLTLLRTNGVTHFKSHDVEIRIGALETQSAGAAVSSEPTIVPRGTGPSSTKPGSAGDIPAKEIMIPHQLNQMMSVLKMNDEDLVDALFPEGAPPPEKKQGGE